MVKWTLLLLLVSIRANAADIIQFKPPAKQCRSFLSGDVGAKNRNNVIRIKAFERYEVKYIPYGEFLERNSGALDDIYVFEPASGKSWTPNFSIRENGEWVHLSSAKLGAVFSGAELYFLSATSAGPRVLDYARLKLFNGKVYTVLRFEREVLLFKEILEMVIGLDDQYLQVQGISLNYRAMMTQSGRVEQIKALVYEWNPKYNGQINLRAEVLKLLHEPNLSFVNLKMRTEFFRRLLQKVNEIYGDRPEAENALWRLSEKFDEIL